MSVTRHDLLRGMRVGAPEPGATKVLLSVEQAFRRYHRGLLRFLRRRLRSDDDAADVAQETYERLLENYRDTLADDTASMLIYRIATNAANDLDRRRRAQLADGHCSIDEVSVASEEPSQERYVSAQQELEAVYAAVLALPPKCQQVFLLHRVDRMTYGEIASTCGISVKMVEKHITKALAVLRTHLGDAPAPAGARSGP